MTSRCIMRHHFMRCFVLKNYIMGWLWLVGWIKLQVSFAKETYKRDAILQKRPIILSILLTVATPYQSLHNETLDYGAVHNEALHSEESHDESWYY